MFSSPACQIDELAQRVPGVSRYTRGAPFSLLDGSMLPLFKYDDAVLDRDHAGCLRFSIGSGQIAHSA